jgi:hypothetical protein
MTTPAIFAGMMGSSGVDIGDSIANSMMLNASSNQYLARNWVAGDRRTYTFSTWVKKLEVGINTPLLCSFVATTDYQFFGFTSGNGLQFHSVSGGAAYASVTTTALFRDTTAFMHVMLLVDTTLATAADRIQIWVNGVRQSVTITTQVPINGTPLLNGAFTHYLGKYTIDNSSTFSYADEYLASTYFVNAQALTPSSFGRISSGTGQWVPNNYTGTYGTNGFKLDFTNGSALGTDSSGNGNNWSVIGGIISENQYTDTPTNNYAVLNQLYTGRSTITKGNLTASGTTDLPTIVPSSGTWYFEIAGVSKTWTPPAAFPSAAGVYNFGQRPFSNTATNPTLCTANLPTPAILKPNKHFDVKRHTGNGTSQSVTGVAFPVGLAWIKGRSSATDNVLYDSVRGPQLELVSNSSLAETTQSTGVTAFTADGITFGASAKMNTNAATYVDWFWMAGGIAVVNNSGTVSSLVSANKEAGFSIVSWENTGNNTVGHGLNQKPQLVIEKSTTSGAWFALYEFIDGTQDYVLLNTTDIKADAGAAQFTSSLINTYNVLGTTYCIAYCFHSVEGYSKVGSYVGNANVDGAFVHCGFKPAFVLIKSTTAADNWRLYDNARPGYNVQGGTLLANTTGIETTVAEVDFTATGFKLRITTTPNAAQTYIFYAVAEAPQKYSTAR